MAQSKNGGIKVKNLVLPNLYIKDDEYIELEKMAKKMSTKIIYLKKGDLIKVGEVKSKMH